MLQYISSYKGGIIMTNSEYITQYRKLHKAQFNIDLNKSEMESVKMLLEKTNMKKVELFRKLVKEECRNNNILYFDKFNVCDWCSNETYTATTYYNSTNEKHICPNCASNIEKEHANNKQTPPIWY